jgi:hypothetical protein
MSALRRYEILLPSQFNDGRPILQGLWRHEGELYRDSLARVFVDAADTAENRQFFVRFKEAPEEPLRAEGHLVNNLFD